MTDDISTRAVAGEAKKTLALKVRNGFVARYLSGSAILDIGYRGVEAHAVPIVPAAIGIDMDYPGYDGLTLPFADCSQDAVYSSHCLEHVPDDVASVREWFRVLKPHAHLIIAVPHQFIYEKRLHLPSRWNNDHKRYYTPATLMQTVEQALFPNSYRIRHLLDNDWNYDYSIPPDVHARGCYEIELVLQKIPLPSWRLDETPEA